MVPCSHATDCLILTVRVQAPLPGRRLRRWARFGIGCAGAVATGCSMNAATLMASKTSWECSSRPSHLCRCGAWRCAVCISSRIASSCADRTSKRSAPTTSQSSRVTRRSSSAAPAQRASPPRSRCTTGPCVHVATCRTDPHTLRPLLAALVGQLFVLTSLLTRRRS